MNDLIEETAFKHLKHTIAFYNLENLFDTKNDPNTLDVDFTPKGKKNWNYKRYKRKIIN